MEWNEFEDALTDLYASALHEFRDEPVYAVALWGVYRELDGVIRLPLLGVAEENGADGADGFWSIRWNPADWNSPEVDVEDELHQRLEAELHAEATAGDIAHWRTVWRTFSEVLVRIARRLGEEAALNKTEDFVAFWHDAEGGHELAARSMADDLARRLFAAQFNAERTLADSRKLPAAARAKLLVSKLGVFEGAITSETAERELLTMGEGALDALIPLLATDRGWQAAALLGKIGVARPDVVQALATHQDQSQWFGVALGMLAAFDALADDAGVQASGRCARLKAISSRGVTPPPLDYRPLEAGLESGLPEEVVAEELAPGSSYVAISKADVDEALRGLESPHAPIRWHACSVLADRGLGNAKRILPELAARLADPHPIVRRLAVLALGDWKASARPYRAQMEALLDDPDDIVARVTGHALKSVGKPKR